MSSKDAGEKERKKKMGNKRKNITRNSDKCSNETSMEQNNYAEEHLFNGDTIKTSGRKVKPNPERIKEPMDMVPAPAETIMKQTTKKEMERYLPSTEELGNIAKYGLARAMLERFLNVEGGPENLNGEEYDRFLKTAAQIHKMYQADIALFLRTTFDDLDEEEAKAMLEKFAHRGKK